jgi:hypothetical protein
MSEHPETACVLLFAPANEVFPFHSMPSAKPFVFTRTSFDPILEELVVALCGGEPIEFKALFTKVHEELKRKKAASGSEEVIRLRCYERLLKLAGIGLVEKRDRMFRALPGIEQALNDHAQSKAMKRKGDLAKRAADLE